MTPSEAASPDPIDTADGPAGDPAGSIEARGERALQALGAEHDRRLHPLSWLFVLLAQLRQFALPLIAFVVFGRRGGEDIWFELMGLAAALVLTFAAVARYFTYRFRIDAGVLVVRSGLLHRNLRQIPLQRIQNVALKQGLLHRLFGVAEVRLESAVGAGTPEAQMQVLSLADAASLESIVQAAGQGVREPASARPAEPASAHASDQDRVLLRLSLAETVRLGLTSNRGLVLGAIGVGAITQFAGENFGRRIADTAKEGVQYAGSLGLDWVHWVALASVFLLGFLAFTRALAVALAVLQFFGFRLVEAAGTLMVESGLLTRLRTRAPLAKIQRWTVHESLLHRWLQRRSVRVETAVLQNGNEQQALTDVIPIATPAEVDALIRRWLPDIEWGDWQWQPLHPNAWRRILAVSILVIAVPAAFAVFHFGPRALLLPVALLPLAVIRARLLARHCGFVLTDHVLAWRSGWLDRHVSFAEVHRLQGLKLTQSPFDRRHGMASLFADTAGSSPLTHQLNLRYLPEARARELFDEISRRIAHSQLRW